MAYGILFGQLQLLACPNPSRCVGVFTDAASSERLRISTDGGRYRPPPSPTS